MAKLSAAGGTVYEWCSAKTGNSYAIRPNGQVLIDRGFGWKNWRHLKSDVTVEDYMVLVKANADYLIGKRAPTVETLHKWADKGYALATDGCKVEPDGTCPHGKLSWLKVRRMI